MQRSARNFLNIKVNKTNKMFLRDFNRANFEPRKLNDVDLQCVFSFKLLGKHIDIVT